MPRTTLRKKSAAKKTPSRVDGGLPTVRKKPKMTKTVKATAKTARLTLNSDEDDVSHVEEVLVPPRPKQTRNRNTLEKDTELVKLCIQLNVDGPKTNPQKKRQEQQNIAHECCFESKEQAMARWGEIKTLIRKAITWEKKQYSASGAGVVLPMKTICDYPGWPKIWKGSEGMQLKATLASLKETRDTFDTSRIKSTTEMDAEVIALGRQNSRSRKLRVTPSEKRMSTLENALMSSAGTLAGAITSSVVHKDQGWLEKKFKELTSMVDNGMLSEEQCKDAMSKALNAYSTN